MNLILNHLSDVPAIFGALVALATVIVGITPNTKDDEILGKIVRVLDVLSILPVKK